MTEFKQYRRSAVAEDSKEWPTGTPWIGVDLDGTLAKYDHWRGIDHIGEPIAPMVERVLGWINQGVWVKVFTARVCADGPAADMARIYIQHWLVEVAKLPQLEITNIKDFGMVTLYDDRARQVEFNTGRLVGP